jgi:hypothetical protein
MQSSIISLFLNILDLSIQLFFGNIALSCCGKLNPFVLLGEGVIPLQASRNCPEVTARLRITFAVPQWAYCRHW